MQSKTSIPNTMGGISHEIHNATKKGFYSSSHDLDDHVGNIHEYLCCKAGSPQQSTGYSGRQRHDNRFTNRRAGHFYIECDGSREKCHDLGCSSRSISGNAVLSGWTNIKGKSQVNVTYDSYDGTSGSDTFTVIVKDSLEAPASIVINVEIVGASTNHPPLAADNSYTTEEDTVLMIGAAGVLANDSDEDGDPLIAVKVANPSNGTILLSADGSFIYTPNADYTGEDGFTYKAFDGLTDSNIATVTITVTKATVPATALWDDIRSYQCTYASDQFLDSSLLSGYDALILEPEAVSVQKLDEIRAQNPNVFLIGYFSIGETSVLLKDSNGRPLDIYFLDKRGKPVQNPIWGSYYVDARKPLWHQLVLEQYLPAIFARGYDGAFLDTVDTSANMQFVDSASGMSNLIKEINGAFSDKKIVINRGFHLLLDRVGYESAELDKMAAQRRWECKKS